MGHANARLTIHARLVLVLVQRVAAGRPVAHVAKTLQTEWAYHDVFLDNAARTAARTAALDPWLRHYNTERGHTALNGLPPISRVQSPT